MVSGLKDASQILSHAVRRHLRAEGDMHEFLLELIASCPTCFRTELNQNEPLARLSQASEASLLNGFDVKACRDYGIISTTNA